MAEGRTVALIVVTHNSALLLGDFFAALPEALAGVSSHDVVVVDSGSTDDTRQVVMAHAPKASFIDLAGNFGYAAGINAGIRAAASADAFLILNPDVRLGPGSVAVLLGALATPGTGVAVPKVTDQCGALLPTLRREPTIARAVGQSLLGGRRASHFRHLGEMVGNTVMYAGPSTAAWASGAVMLVSRECSEAVGPWDESLFLYSEETDFDLRAGDAGFVVRFVPGATACHLGGEVATSPPLWSLLTVNRVRVYRKRHGRLATVGFTLAVALNETIRAGRGGATHRSALRALATPWRWASEPALRAGQTPGHHRAGSDGTGRAVAV